MEMRFKAAVAFAVLAGFSVLVTGKFLLAVRTSAAAERGGSCLTLHGEPLQAQAPDFELPDLQGRKHRLSELRGKTVLLNFWFTGCKPCVEEIPSLVALQARRAGKDFALLTVSVDDAAADVKSFLGKLGVREGALPLLLDTSKKVPESYGTSKYPETFLIDREGVVRYKFVWKRDWAGEDALRCVGSL